MENVFTQDDWGLALDLMGVRSSPYKGGYRAQCPIHRGDNPKAFAVWVDESGLLRASCHSHQCVKASSLEWVVSKSMNCTLKEAVEWLSTQFARPLSMPDPKRQRELVILPSIQESISFCDLDALGRLREAYPNHPYWLNRGYSPEAISDYRLTYRGLDKRMVIPVFDDLNRFVGMMTRTLDPNDPVKYKWESPNSSKARWLYGIPQALARTFTVGGRRATFLVEGTLDVIKASAAGFPVVASQTNRLSADQAQQLLSHWDLIFVIPDNDEPGQNLIKEVRKYAGPFLDVAVVVLPNGIKDLDEIPADALPDFLNNTIASWSKQWLEAPRRNRQMLVLNPSLSPV